jgi:hypothetical protein
VVGWVLARLGNKKFTLPKCEFDYCRGSRILKKTANNPV